MVRPFKLDSADFDTVLHPLAFDILVAASWGSSGGSWIMKHLQLTAILGRVRCYKVDAGTPDETAELIEATVLGKPWDCP